MQQSLNLILEEIREVFQALDPRELQVLVNSIMSAEKVFVTGVGRVLLSLEAFVKRLNHIGIKAFYVGQIDEPFATSKDLLIVASNSGESVVPRSIAEKAERLGVPVLYIGSNWESSVGKLAKNCVVIPVSSKMKESGRIQSNQPMTSLFEQVILLLGDAVAMEIIHQKQIETDDFWKYHANLE